jgi:hypothetical protein
VKKIEFILGAGIAKLYVSESISALIGLNVAIHLGNLGNTISRFKETIKLS